MKIFDIIHSESFKTFVFFITATIGVISALLTLEPLASMIIIFIAIVAYFVFFTIPSKTSNQKIRVLKKEFEKIFGRTTGLQIKAVEVIVDLMRIRPEYINDVIDFDLLYYQGTITKNGNYRGMYRAQGCNPKTESCKSLKILMGSGSWESINLKAFDTNSNEELKIDSFRHEKAEIITFEILFQHPISQREKFDVTWSFEFPHACSTIEDDADVFLMWPFKNINGCIEIDLSLMFKPKSIQLYYIDKKFNVALHTEDKPSISTYQSRKYRYSILIKNPAFYHAFILVYRI